VAIHELEDRPLDLIKRYRTLCEATGLARANRVPLAPTVQDELADLEQRLLVLLDAEPAGPRPLGRAADASSHAAAPRDLAARAIGDARAPDATSRGLPTSAPAGEAPAPVPSIPKPTRLLPPVPRPADAQSTDPVGEPVVTPEKLSATIFTDGAAEGNPGPGGYCAIVRIPGRPDRELSGSSIHTTNNKMELLAAIAGLRAVVDAGIGAVTVNSDSEYLVKGMNEWLPEWDRRGWKTTTGQPVKNQDLWQQLASLSRGRHVEWHWVKGHAGHPENERCDDVATAAARRAARARPT